MLHGLTIVGAIHFLKARNAEEEQQLLLLCICACQTTSMLNPLFFCTGPWVVKMLLQASLLQPEGFRQRKCLCKQVLNTALQDTLRTLSSDQIGCWPDSTCAEADMMGSKRRVVTDFFVACMRATDFYTCCSFCWQTHDDRFLCTLFLVTDFFEAHDNASDVHLGAFSSQNHNGTDC